MTHKFKIGQTVELIPNRLDGNIPAGSYTIQRLLPAEGRTLQYRVKNARDGHERVVRETQIARAQNALF